MILAILADKMQQEEITTKPIPGHVEIVWADSVKTLQAISDAAVYIDLLFRADAERMQQLKKLLNKPVLINSVTDTLAETNRQFIRINGWAGFLKRDIMEIAAEKDRIEIIPSVFAQLGWNFKLVPDIPGMISARIVASVINEAYHTWGAGISSREDIDTAMQLGTNYPSGPFEWCRQIGIEKVYGLLNRLQKDDSRYEPAQALKKEFMELPNASSPGLLSTESN